ncbi:MAG: HlyC/CorC family transporter [Phycisphaerae bacterium]|nr:HlyC/CorC family transporter [Phycisphaerae bacterium]
MDPDSWCLLFSLISVLLSLFFSVVAKALDNISWSRLEEAFDKGNKSHRLDYIRRNLSALTTSAAILKMLAALVVVLSVSGYIIVRNNIHLDRDDNYADLSWLILWAFCISGFILSITSIAIPFAWAKYAGMSFLVRSYRVVILMQYISWPLVKTLSIFDPVVRRLSGVPEEGSAKLLEQQQEELLSVVEEREKQGIVDEEELEMIESVLEFRDTTAGEIMTPRTETIGIDSTLSYAQAIEVVVETGYSRYPVYENSIDNVIGIMYAKDLLALHDKPDDRDNLRQFLRNPYYVPESKSLRDLLHDFQDQKVHVAVVLDEYGGTAGVVTIEDIIEELVGEIEDEHEPPRQESIKRINETTIDIDARYDVDEFNDEFDVNIPEDEDYETIGGFAFAKLGYIPNVGESFEHDNMLFTIIDAQQRKINRLRIEIRADNFASDTDK